MDNVYPYLTGWHKGIRYGLIANGATDLLSINGELIIRDDKPVEFETHNAAIEYAKKHIEEMVGAK
jgi:hypothetical protein